MLPRGSPRALRTPRPVYGEFSEKSVTDDAESVTDKNQTFFGKVTRSDTSLKVGHIRRSAFRSWSDTFGVRRSARRSAFGSAFGVRLGVRRSAFGSAFGVRRSAN